MKSFIYLATPLVVFSGDVAKTFRGEDLGDDGAVAGEDDQKRDEVSEQRVDPVPRTDEEVDKMLVQVARQLGLLRVVAAGRIDGEQVVAEEEVEVGAEQHDGDDRPDDDDAST